MEKQIAKHNVELVEKTFGVKLPELKLYVSSREISSHQEEKDGVTYPGKWGYKEGGTIIPLELEVFFPKEGMTPFQAIEQLDVCSSIAMGWANDSYKIYEQSTLMRFFATAILNCIYLASKDFGSWNQKGEDEITALDKIEKQKFIFYDGFRADPPRDFYKDHMNQAMLRLLLENSCCEKGEKQEKNQDICGNTIYGNLFYEYVKKNSSGGADKRDKYVYQMLMYKCYEITDLLK